MAKLSVQEKICLKRKFSNTGFSLTGTPLKVAEATNGELGFTDKSRVIFLAFEHAYYKALSVVETISFITGTYVHEVMHLLMTNFKIFSSTIQSVPKHEQEILHDIYNIIEDSCIEYFAPLYVSDTLLKALNFTRATIYKNSHSVDEYDEAFVQFICACIQYGDAGLIKGTFTFPEAQKCFAKCLPIMDAAVEEPVNEKRAKYALEIFELSRPLWTEHAENTKAMMELIEKLKGMMKDAGKSNKTSSGTPNGTPLSPPDGSEKPEETERTRRRKITFKRISTEEYEKALEEAKKTEGAPDEDGDIMVLIPEEPTEERPESPEPSTNPLSIPSEESDENEAEQEEAERKAERSLEEETTVGKEDAERIQEEMDALKAKISEEERKENEVSAKSLDIPLATTGYQDVCKNVRCKNVRRNINLADEDILKEKYHNIIEPLQPVIQKLTHQLGRILKNAADEKSYRTSGKVNIDRLASGTKTARVFEKRKLQTRNDVRVCIAIDNSYSMNGIPIMHARTSAITLAEVFSKLGIPISMFGFTADHAGYEVYHEHYITGSNTLRDRLRLLGISAIENNFDGYSIRYAAQMLKTKPAVHKILIIISDGCPCCRSYYRANGIMDTKLAIKEASKHATVFGILVGDVSPEIHQEMYGYNFLHIENPADLATGLVRCLSKKLQEW